MQFEIRKVNGVLHFLRAKLGWPWKPVCVESGACFIGLCYISLATAACYLVTMRRSLCSGANKA